MRVEIERIQKKAQRIGEAISRKADLKEGGKVVCPVFYSEISRMVEPLETGKIPPSINKGKENRIWCQAGSAPRTNVQTWTNT